MIMLIRLISALCCQASVSNCAHTWFPHVLRPICIVLGLGESPNNIRLKWRISASENVSECAHLGLPIPDFLYLTMISCELSDTGIDVSWDDESKL